MASGTITGTTSSDYCISKIEWTSTPDTSKNSSTVTAKLYLKRTNSSGTYGNDWDLAISIGGVKTNIKPGRREVNQSWLLMAEATTTISHDTDGTKSIEISADGGCPGTSVTKINCKGTVKLDNIPRASSITSIPDSTIGSQCPVTWTPNSTAFSYRLKFSLGNWSETTDYINPNTTNAYTYTGWNIPPEVANQITNSKTGKMTATLYTYSGGSQIGTASKTFTVTVPQSAAPIIESVSISPVNDGVPEAFKEMYIQDISKADIRVSAKTQYGASVSSYLIMVNGKNYGDPGVTTDILNTYGAKNVIITITDTRGYSTTETKTIDVVPYAKPMIQDVAAYRCYEDADIKDDGTYILVKAKRVYSSVNEKNTCAIQCRYEGGGVSSDWETVLAGNREGNDGIDGIETSPLFDGNISPEKSYTVYVSAVDTIGSRSTTAITIPTDKVYWHRDGAKRAFAFGTYVQDENTFLIADDIELLPTGGIGLIGESKGSDLNDLKQKNGSFYASPLVDNWADKHYPVYDQGILEVKTNGNIAWQVYFTLQSTSIYVRKFNVGWGQWQKIL